jgi:lysozyme
MSTYTVSDAGVEVTKGFEGFRTKAYQDGGGQWTIGYGTSFFPDGHAVKAGDTITLADATAALTVGIQQRLDYVSRNIVPILNQNQVDAIADFCYNIGTGNFLSSTFLKDLNLSNYAAAAAQLIYKEANGTYGGWVHDAQGNIEPGLVHRRIYEQSLFLAPATQVVRPVAFDSSLEGAPGA